MNTIDWGQAAVNNTIGFGKSATNNTIDFGEVCADSWSPETNLTGAGGVPPFSNTKSIELDGIDDFVSMGTDSSLSFGRLDTYSFSAWVKIDSTGLTHTIFSNQKADSLPSTNFRGYFFAVNTSNKIIVILRSTLSDRFIFTSTTSITTSTWNHIVFTYDGSATQSGGQIYINGSIDTITRVGSLIGGTNSLDGFYLGSRYNYDNFFDGNIDEVSVYNSQLSASDVTSIYNGAEPNDISSLSPLSWWRCGDDDTSPTLTDNGSGGNDGTMTNFTTFSTDVPT